jgi:hypothetical protein
VAEGAGFEIPKGSPSELRAAATAWSALGDLLDEQITVLTGAATTVVGADWNGPASLQYSMTSTLVGMSISTGSSACEDAAQACKAFARALKDAQERAKDAKHRAENAITRRDAAQTAVGEAQTRITTANTAAENAAHQAGVAGAAGPAGAGALANAREAGRAAGRAREAADADLRRAEHQLHDAEGDLKRARRDGEDANDDAERAGRTAAAAFSAVRGSASGAAVPSVGQPVPVSLRGASPDMAGLNGGFGGAFHAPGRFARPGDVRASQIAKQRQAEIDAAEAEKDRLGTIGDGLSGLVHSATLGIVDLGGDKDTNRYRGGNLAGYLVPGEGLVKIGGKVVAKAGTKLAARKIEKEAAELAQKKALQALREKQVAAKAKALRLDKRHGETFADVIARHRKAAEAYTKELEEIARKDAARKIKVDVGDLADQLANTLAAHRPGGIPQVLVEILKHPNEFKGGAQQLINLAKGWLKF